MKTKTQTKLRVSRKEVEDKLVKRIQEGRGLKNSQILSENVLHQICMISNHWSLYNRDLLLQLFDPKNS